MAHQIQGKSSVPLDVFGGLITNIPAEGIPEGSSPLCFDCDFIVSNVFTRGGLSSPYSIAE